MKSEEESYIMMVTLAMFALTVAMAAMVFCGG